MITDSYSASCYIENNDGTYHMECDMSVGEKNFYSKYEGENFVDGINIMMDSLTKQLYEKPEPELMSLEDRVKYLEELVTTLKDEKADLINKVNELTNKSEEKIDNKIDDTIKQQKDDAMKQWEDIIEKFYGDKKNYNTFNWPFSSLVIK